MAQLIIFRGIDGMNRKSDVLITTEGQGVTRSIDDGESRNRSGVNQGIYTDAIVHSLASGAHDT